MTPRTSRSPIPALPRGIRTTTRRRRPPSPLIPPTAMRPLRSSRAARQGTRRPLPGCSRPVTEPSPVTPELVTPEAVTPSTATPASTASAVTSRPPRLLKIDATGHPGRRRPGRHRAPGGRRRSRRLRRGLRPRRRPLTTPGTEAAVAEVPGADLGPKTAAVPAPDPLPAPTPSVVQDALRSRAGDVPVQGSAAVSPRGLPSSADRDDPALGASAPTAVVDSGDVPAAPPPARPR